MMFVFRCRRPDARANVYLLALAIVSPFTHDGQVVDRGFMGEKGVYSLAFAPNSKRVAFGGGSSDICVWDL